ncbi:hypothetical protein R3P38DRAFT_3229633 [Favolaschia claudopus]|uniref:Uncharacterized protein n=1 Tax=Favolaschia claudopus TaxID=2862362 RepID=A0AAV9ZPG3_9AGAR
MPDPLSWLDPEWLDPESFKIQESQKCASKSEEEAALQEEARVLDLLNEQTEKEMKNMPYHVVYEWRCAQKEAEERERVSRWTKERERMETVLLFHVHQPTIYDDKLRTLVTRRKNFQTSPTFKCLQVRLKYLILFLIIRTGVEVQVPSFKAFCYNSKIFLKVVGLEDVDDEDEIPDLMPPVAEESLISVRCPRCSRRVVKSKL